MKNKTLLLILIVLSFTYSNAQVEADKTINVYPDFEQFSKDYLQNKDNDTIYVVNFWATWCRPCVEELPLFDSINQAYKNQKLKLVLVSLDMVDSAATKVVDFISNKQISSEVVVLTDGRTNRWIDLIDPNWSGAIPFTIVKYNQQSAYYEKQYHSYADLEKNIQEIKTLKP